MNMPTGKLPVDHILRPILPWRDDQSLTECGYDAAKVKTITRDEYQQRKRDLGSQRCAMLTCMTCSQTAERWESWSDDPRKAIGREVEWETGWRGVKRGERLLDELYCIAQLIEAHRHDFDSILANIQSRREWVVRKSKGRHA